MTTPRTRPHAVRLWWWIGILFAAACSGGGSCGGCACLQPIPGGYTGTKLDNAVSARVTNEGFQFMSQNFTALLQQAGVANPMTLPVACSPQLGGNFCDQNRNGRCDSGEQCNVQVSITSLNLAPRDATAADTGIIHGSMQLQIATGTMWYFRECVIKVLGLCVCDLACSANFSSTRSGAQQETLTADVNFTIDMTWGRILAFNVANIAGLNNLESNDLDINGSGVCGSLTCGILDLGFIKGIVVDQVLIPELRNQVQSAIDDARCMTCNTTAECPTGATCSGGACQAGGSCVPLMLGMEGRADLSQSGLGLPMSGAVDLYAVAGGTVSSATNAHFTAGVIGGGAPYSGTGDGGVALRDPALCVPALPEPSGVIPAPDWGAADGGYHVGIAVSQKWVEQMMWATHQAGGMCIDITTAQVGLVSSDLFKPLLPSLGKIAPTDTPMMIALRPRAPPEVTIGAGTYDPVTKQPIDPLLNLAWTDLDIDVYLLIDDRYARLFRLIADVKMPLSLVFEGCDQVTPAIGDVKQLLTNVRAVDSEILAEDPQDLANLIPTFLTVAEPSLAGALGSQTLPSLGSFRLKVNEAKGITPIAGTGTYEHLGLFAELLDPSGTCTTTSPQLAASLASAEVPSVAQLKDRRYPTATVKVAPGGGAPLEYAFRVDRGLWSTFAPVPSGALPVSSPGLVLQGRHLIEVRARDPKNPHAVSAPAPVDFVVDYMPPSVILRADRANDRLLVKAHDTVTPDARLQFAYEAPGSTAPAFGPERELVLSEIEAQGGLTVSVRDQAGLVGTASWKVPVIALRPEAEVQPEAERGGCASVPGAMPLLLGLWLWVRRRRAGERS